MSQGPIRRFVHAALACLFLAGCRGPRPESPAPQAAARAPLAQVGFTIQAGAFAQAEHASRLAEVLQAKGLDATYYAARPGLYRVRFGDFPTREAARLRAEALKAGGVIQEYFLVPPREAPLVHPAPGDEEGLRAGLVETARNYLGVPYLWGGATAKGFDCSGLAMAVYRLNGLKLPRSSREQYEAGAKVAKAGLRPGDLVFFATSGTGEVTHVGIFIGGDTFIHAPARGRHISRDHLGEPYFKERFLGGCTFLG